MQTVDFFTPIVDDPFVYGQIAAANALSDVYAMGGRPLTALAIAALSEGRPTGRVLATIFSGGLDKLREAGVALLGGHTVQDTEIKFGYAVTGEVDRGASGRTPARGRRRAVPDQSRSAPASSRRRSSSSARPRDGVDGGHRAR